MRSFQGRASRAGTEISGGVGQERQKLWPGETEIVAGRDRNCGQEGQNELGMRGTVCWFEGKHGALQQCKMNDSSLECPPGAQRDPGVLALQLLRFGLRLGWLQPFGFQSCAKGCRVGFQFATVTWPHFGNFPFCMIYKPMNSRLDPGMFSFTAQEFPLALKTW